MRVLVRQAELRPYPCCRSQALYLLGGKDLWTSELEAALTQRSIDLIVHSLKDIPTVLGPTFKLSGVTERAEPRDALVMKRGLETTYRTLEELPEGSVVGTSSVRRVAQLRRNFPGLKFMDVVRAGQGPVRSRPVVVGSAG